MGANDRIPSFPLTFADMEEYATGCYQREEPDRVAVRGPSDEEIGRCEHGALAAYCTACPPEPFEVEGCRLYSVNSDPGDEHDGSEFKRAQLEREAVWIRTEIERQYSLVAPSPDARESKRVRLSVLHSRLNKISRELS